MGAHSAMPRFIFLARFVWKPRSIALKTVGLAGAWVVNTGSVAGPSPQNHTEVSSLCLSVSATAAAYVPKHSWC